MTSKISLNFGYSKLFLNYKCTQQFARVKFKKFFKKTFEPKEGLPLTQNLTIKNETNGILFHCV
jgi:hypothetical protein